MDKKVNLNDLVYRYKGRNSDEKFDEYDNALDLNKKRKQQKKIKGAKKCTIQYWNALQSKKQGY